MSQQTLSTKTVNASDSQPERAQVFQIDGISCLDCAGDFERDVNRLPGVEKAVLNAMTGKLTVIGRADLDAIQRIGKMENYTVTRHDNTPHGQVPNEVAATSATLSTTSTHRIGFGFLRTDQTKLWRLLISGVTLLLAALSPIVPFPPQVAIFFYVVATITGGWENMKKAFFSIRQFRFNMAVLMTIAVIGAMVIGEWGEGAVVAFLFSLSDMLEAWSLSNARRSVDALMKMAPEEATILSDSGPLRVPVAEVNVGDIVVVKPGETIPVDGTVKSGHSSVDQSPITGESTPVEKTANDAVFSGSINTFGALEIRVDKLAADSTISKILSLVTEAQTKKTTTAAFVDRFAAVYTPVVLIVALGVAVVPPVLFGQPSYEWIYRGLALLVVACPCALVVSTPVAIISAMSAAAKNGVLVKGGIHLENTARLEAMAFDKTGTLTVGRPVVTDIIPATGVTEEELLETAVSIEAFSEHPIAKAIMDEGNNRHIHPIAAESFLAHPGEGATAVIEGRRFLAGNTSLFRGYGVATHAMYRYVDELESQGKTAVLIGRDDRLLGIIAVADQVRPESRAMIADMKDAGIRHTAMLTGDNKRAANHIAQATGIDQVLSELLPDDKAHALEQLLQQYGHVGMVGDGINDAPALATATVGIAMGGAGTDAALETADIALMADDLSKLPYTIDLSRRTMRIIKTNIYFSIGIKIIAVAAIFPGILTLWLAILADMGATIIVTLNGMRLLKQKHR